MSALRVPPCFRERRPARAYRDFLDLWKDADPDIPLLMEANKEYVALNR
jgi:hypothetical protein